MSPGTVQTQTSEKAQMLPWQRAPVRLLLKDQGDLQRWPIELTLKVLERMETNKNHPPQSPNKANAKGPQGLAKGPACLAKGSMYADGAASRAN